MSRLQYMNGQSQMEICMDKKLPHSSDGLDRSLPSAVNISADAVQAFLDDAQAQGLELHSLQIHRDGKLAVEGWQWPYSTDHPRIMHSVAKSFTACAIAFALAEDRFALTDRVISFFPDQLPPVVDEHLAAMAVLDLLTMRTGHAEETSGSRWRGIATSWIAEFFKIPVVHRPGDVYVYTSAASYMLSAIVSKVTGQRLHEYLKPRLFEPLGIANEIWDVGPDGINPGGNGLTCKPIDLMKFGILHAQNGVWKGKQVLPLAWVKEATQPHGDSEYGYHWVTGPDGEFYAMGLFGQLIAVLPRHDAVVVITSAIGGQVPCSGHLLPLLHRHQEAIFTDLQVDPGADERLQMRFTVSSKSRTLASGVKGNNNCDRVLEYAVEENPLGIQRLSLQFKPDVCDLRLVGPNGAHSIAVGIDRWIAGETDISGEQLHHGYDMSPARVLAGAQWLAAGTLEMTWVFFESAFRDRVVFIFSDDAVTMSRSVNVNSGATKLPDIVGHLVGE